ncbi:MAG: hypothetical protein LBN30_05535 [Oscillospiraceae bacterium]|jgi:hypothetical protein|nr:hypothetical protein [Oscillospiraceae bacterium]
MYVYSKAMGEQLIHTGYRGVCGIDYLVLGDELLMLEINPRFLGSSFLVEQALRDNHLQSLREMNISAFNHGWIDSDYAARVENMSIGYDSATYSYFKDFQSYDIARFLENCKRDGTVYLDGFDLTQSLEHDAYLRCRFRHTRR